MDKLTQPCWANRSASGLIRDPFGFDPARLTPRSTPIQPLSRLSGRFTSPLGRLQRPTSLCLLPQQTGLSETAANRSWRRHIEPVLVSARCSCLLLYLDAVYAMRRPAQWTGTCAHRQTAFRYSLRRGLLAHPRGLEPLTIRVEAGCSIQLSYERASRSSMQRPVLNLRHCVGATRTYPSKEPVTERSEFNLCVWPKLHPQHRITAFQ